MQQRPKHRTQVTQYICCVQRSLRVESMLVTYPLVQRSFSSTAGSFWFSMAALASVTLSQLTMVSIPRPALARQGLVQSGNLPSEVPRLRTCLTYASRGEDYQPPADLTSVSHIARLSVVPCNRLPRSARFVCFCVSVHGHYSFLAGLSSRRVLVMPLLQMVSMHWNCCALSCTCGCLYSPTS